MPDPMKSFVRTRAERRLRVEHAGQMADAVLAAVRYVDIDYARERRAGGHEGPRRIVDEVEWRQPSWRYEGFDSIDYGVEFECVDGRVFSVTWQSPGWIEGLIFWEQPLIGNAVVSDAAVAVWDVSSRSGWQDFVGRTVRGVHLRYEPWSDEGYWCRQVVISFRRGDVALVLGEARAPDWRLEPSADNVAVIFPGSPLARLGDRGLGPSHADGFK
ncbi:hypothetical protein [Dactylosporangium sp. NPDC000521]|uniref:hypothetical protein n=1 Tax=Dactylosporangium sp. NPDC000521 TaxID=3363975 RepID=UPI00367AA616